MWKSIRIYYYDNYDHLISKLIPKLLPNSSVFRAIPDQIERFYFTRHWIGGPHIRLNFELNDDKNWESLYKIISCQIERFLVEYPSKSTLVNKNWDKYTTALLKLEQQKAHENETKLHPDNFWEIDEYSIRSSMYGGEKGAQLAENFYSDTTDIVCDLVSYSINKPNDRINLFIQMMAALVYCTHINFYISYRSHFEGHMNVLTNKDKIKEKVSMAYESKKDWYLSLVKDTFQKVEEIQSGKLLNDDLINKWVEIVTEYHKLILKEVQLGLLPFQPDSKSFSRISDFHQNAYSNQIVQDFSSTSVFQAQRFLFSFMYNIFNVMGVTPLKRSYLCYFAAESIGIVTGKSWEMILKETADAKIQYVDNEIQGTLSGQHYPKKKEH
ncbi:lantibiotic dehydratase C-terminal domain-containing protein [Bacillus sp. FSL K6-1003]|uniref:lantibiotic dehydratase C-terminal domain-containing protein n=1 Tax=Bacillus sp. FSL K6-1003 TaxID=2954675 RepID=UPI0030D48CDA